MAYNKTTWVNNQAPALDADHLNHIEQGIKDAHEELEEKADVADIPTKVSDLTNDAGYQNAAQVAAAVEESEPLDIDFPTFSSFPQTQTNSKITTDMKITGIYFTNPSAITSGEITCNTDTAGSVTISGSISGSTAMTVTLQRKRS